MTVIRADILGFCAGVRRAVSAAERALDERDARQRRGAGADGCATDAARADAGAGAVVGGASCAAGASVKNAGATANAVAAMDAVRADVGDVGRVYTLGPLIHNPVALSELSKRDLRVLAPDGISALTPQDTVLIRAHGVPPATDAALRATGCTVINATCPLVTQSQKRAARFAERGYTIIFAGDKNHGEVIGIQGYAEAAARACGGTCRFLLVRTAEEAETLTATGQLCAGAAHSTETSAAPAVLLSQTTFSIHEFERISAVLRARLPHIEIVSSICPATHERQDALKRLCERVDGVIVIGGRESSNTARLYATAQKRCAHAALIERAEEIPAAFFGLVRVGITAGASTPDSVIAAVEARLQQGL